jgi:NTP pyrophosphatase (non-canonical NTP hydrolase)
MGFKVPVAVTSNVWEECIEWSESDNKQTYQNLTGRLNDVLWMLYLACRKSEGSICLFAPHVIPRDGQSKKTKLIKLKSVIGGGDEGEPVITIMLPTED